MAEAKTIQCPGCSKKCPAAEEFCDRCGIELQPQSQSSEAEEVKPEGKAAPENPQAVEEARFLSAPDTPIQVRSAGDTNVGLVKKNNEDSLIVREVLYPKHQMAVHVAIVCDGMGGYPAGEVFAELGAGETWLGIRSRLAYFEQQNFDRWGMWQFLNNQIKTGLVGAVTSANGRVRDYGLSEGFKFGEFGATIVVAVAICDLKLGHVVLYGYNDGDTKAILITDNASEQLSTDHVVGGAPIRFLGKFPHVSGSTFEREFWLDETDLETFQIAIYSDGVWNMLDEPKIATICRRHPARPLRSTREVTKTALQVKIPAGQAQDPRVQVGDDNLTNVIISITKNKEKKDESTD